MGRWRALGPLAAAPKELLVSASRTLLRARASSELVLAILATVIVGTLVFPLRPWMVDLGLGLNLAVAFALLASALSARDALQVTAFPSVLLLTTLFRLALNVSSTRLALAEGHAGKVIQAFGDFVVRGDFAVGAVIFAILATVQFVVVTKGSERIAEVAARFSLDAMPGKQMAIDADLRAGALSQEEARGRRRALERESQLFGAMDGAMKFVKGDVVAGLVIVAVNLFVGTALGALRAGLSLKEAAEHYALIAIGDGLVSQLPSLTIAVAAAAVVTRVGSDEKDASLGRDIGMQFFGKASVYLLLTLVCATFALIPGMPHGIFATLALAGGCAGYWVRRRAPDDTSQRTPKTADASRTGWRGVSPLILDLGSELTWIVEVEGGRFASADLENFRERMYATLGVRLPPFRVRTGAFVNASDYALAIDEVPAGGGTFPKGWAFSRSSVATLLAQGFPATQVADAHGPGLAALEQEVALKLIAAGGTVLAAPTLLAERVFELLRRKCEGFLGVQEVHVALQELGASAGALVREATQKVPLPLLTEVLRKLLQERVSIRNLKAILEALAQPSAEGDAQQLAERCRATLSRQLSHQYAGDGLLYAYLVDPHVEAALRNPALDPAEAAAILDGIRGLNPGERVVLIASADVRRMLRRLVEGTFPNLPVLSFAELDSELQVRPIGRLVAALPP